MANRMQPSDFQRVQKIGEGAYSKVYLMRHTPDGHLYAVKVLRRITENDFDENQRRIIAATNREVRILQMCDHPHVLPFFAVLQTEDDRMYVTEYCKGGDLDAVIRLKRTIPLDAARYITAEIAAALHYLHNAPKKPFPIVPGAPLKKATVIHRDVKPKNIVFTADRHVKLIDFGSASNPLEEIQPGDLMSFVGTVHYMSPEMLTNPDFTCPASDFWSLGCVLFEMLTGRKPFDGAYLALMTDICQRELEFPPDFDANAKDLCQKLLEKDPAKRLCTEEAVLAHPFMAPVSDIGRSWIRNAPWEEDSSVAACRGCHAKFTLFLRRHHCRNCGQVVCSKCSMNVCLIPDSTFRAAERVCDSCYTNLLERETQSL